MKDAIGGYFGLENYSSKMLYDKSLHFNYARYCLEYVIKVRKIKKIYVPKYLCDSIARICKKNNVIVIYYDIDINFMPKNLNAKKNEWVYIVNYYGQLSNDTIKKIQNESAVRVIVDSIQAYFQKPINGIDTIYSCRKYFGVPDGGILITDLVDDKNIKCDDSLLKMSFVLGRFNSYSEKYYDKYLKVENNIAKCGLKKMSKITENLLHSLDYKRIKTQRTENFKFLNQVFKRINKFKLKNVIGGFMYPLYIDNGDVIRNKLIKKRIYTPVLWADTYKVADKSDIVCDMTRNTIMLPIDQRYNLDDMKWLVNEIKNIL